MRKTQFLQFLQFCTVRTAEQCTQQRTAAAIDTAVGSRGRAQRAGCVLCAQALCASMRSARSACLLAARTARCFYHERLPLAPSSCPSSPSRSRQALPALASLLATAQPIGCKGNSKGNSANAVACAPLHPHATATATAGQCCAAGQCGSHGDAVHRQRPQQRPQPAQCKGRGHGKGVGLYAPNHIQCKGVGSKSRPVQGRSADRCTACSSAQATSSAEAQAVGATGSGEGGGGGGGLFVTRMGRLFLAPSRKFLNFSTPCPCPCTHRTPCPCTLQTATAPAAAPAAAGHTGGIGHRGMA